LDEEIRKTVALLPEDKRIAVVAHNAFRYFGRDYGVSFLAPQGVTTESEASAADVASIIREIRSKRASAVFSENISDTRLVDQIASEAGLSVGGVLFSDALSSEEGPAPSYIEMMRHNTQTMFSALKGN
jgi:zinc/manganese transport system substrate-binding protein